MMGWFPAWPMLLPLVAVTLLPFADAFKGQGVLRRAKTIVKGIPAALRDIVDDIDVLVILEESTAEPASEVFSTTTQPEKEPVLEVLQYKYAHVRHYRLVKGRNGGFENGYGARKLIFTRV